MSSTAVYNNIFKTIRARTKKEETKWFLNGKRVRCYPSPVTDLATCPLVFAVNKFGANPSQASELGLEATDRREFINAADGYDGEHIDGTITKYDRNLRRRILRACGLEKGR